MDDTEPYYYSSDGSYYDYYSDETPTTTTTHSSRSENSHQTISIRPFTRPEKAPNSNNRSATRRSRHDPSQLTPMEQKLYLSNILAAGLQIVVGIITVIILARRDSPTFRTTRSKFLIPPSVNGQWQPAIEFLVPAGTISIQAMLCVIPWFTALFHLYPVAFFGDYISRVRRGTNWMRWLEYSISASMMTVIVAVLSGCTQTIILTNLFGLTFALMWFGYFSDVFASIRSKDWALSGWLPHLLGYPVWAFFYVPIIYYFWLIVDDSKSLDPTNKLEIPRAVKAIPFVILFFYWTFAINQMLARFRVWRWRNPAFSEYVYILLSFTSKTILIGLALGGITREQRN